jgi:hypothetical protein
MVLKTKIASAKAGTKSMKSTVPEGIVEFLKLEDKDELEWGMEIQKDERIAIVKKAIPPKDSVELARYSFKEKQKRKRE